MTDNNFLIPQSKPEAALPKKLPCPFSAAGMLQPSHLQPPPMFGPRGPTIPPKHLAPYAHFKINRSQPRFNANHKNYINQNRSNNSGFRYQNKSPNNNHTKPPQRYQTSREFFCEPCDRDFSSQDLFLEHKSQHQKCGIDGCKFEGHEIIVTKHIQMQHSTGLYDRLKNLETPEDILKWREERKKRYPTKANIELRQQMQEERNKRGEKLNDSKARFGRNSDRRRLNNSKSTEQNNVPDGKKEGKRKRRRPNKKVILNVEQRAEVNECQREDENDDKDSGSNNGLPRFRGTSQMKNYKKRKEVQPKNALSSLLGMYESDSDSDASGHSVSSDLDDSESPEEIENEMTTLKLQEMSDDDAVQETNARGAESMSNVSKSNSTTEDFVENESLEIDVDDLPSEEPIVKQEPDNDAVTSIEIPKTVQKSKRKTKHVDQRISKKPTLLDLSKKYRNQNTMLEKLLQNEIRHERNVLLQCVRQVVKVNFFGIGQKSSSSVVDET